MSLFRKRENNMIYRVKEPFSYTDDRGVPRVMRVGDLVTTSHDAYREKWAHLFEPVAEAAERAPAAEVEAATAAPGEKRSLSTSTLASKQDGKRSETADDPQKAELEALRAEAEKAGVKVDGRWGVDKLREEIEAARKPKSKS